MLVVACGETARPDSGPGVVDAVEALSVEAPSVEAHREWVGTDHPLIVSFPTAAVDARSEVRRCGGGGFVR